MWMILTPEIAEYRFQSFDDDEPGATYSNVRVPRLKTHVEQWISENITGEWEVRCKEIGIRLDSSEFVWWETHPAGKTDRSYKWTETIAIQFESVEDAAIFKMFWL